MTTSAPLPQSGAAGPRIRHGVDLVYVPRLREILATGPAFQDRVFTRDECAYCLACPDPAPHFAARFAAKEATLKALGMGITPLGIDARLQQVEVRRVGTAPVLSLHGRVARAAARLAVASTTVSLTHDGDHALASVLLLMETPA